jgi:adenylate cyclase
MNKISILEDLMAQKLTEACLVCSTTLEGPLGWMYQLFGITRSSRNPNVCNRCDAHLQEGKVIEMSVIFADLTGFTEMTNRLGPERSYEVVDSFFKMANEVLVKHDAFIDKYIGDAVMAIFNAPIQNKEHSREATAAALGIQQGLKLVANDLNLDLQARVGVASGYARVGRIGSNDRKDYTAIGDVVNLASRLEAFAQPGEIMLDERVFERVADDYPEATPEELNVRGFAQPVAAYRIGKAYQENVIPSLPPDPLARRQAVSLGAVLFAILGAPCALTVAVSPLAVVLGLGAAFGALGPLMHTLDAPQVRIPLQFFAVLGAVINLYVIWYGRAQRQKSGDFELTRFEQQKVTLVTVLSVVSLLAVAFESYAHVFIEKMSLF